MDTFFFLENGHPQNMIFSNYILCSDAIKEINCLISEKIVIPWHLTRVLPS